MSDEVEFLLYDALPCTLLALAIRLLIDRTRWRSYSSLIGFLAGLIWHLQVNRWPFFPKVTQWQWMAPGILTAGAAGFLLHARPGRKTGITIAACCGIALLVAPRSNAILIAAVLIVDSLATEESQRFRPLDTTLCLTAVFFSLAWISNNAGISSLAGLNTTAMICLLAVSWRSTSGEGTLLVAAVIIVGTVAVLCDRVIEDLPLCTLLALAPAIQAGPTSTRAARISRLIGLAIIFGMFFGSSQYHASSIVLV